MKKKRKTEKSEKKIRQGSKEKAEATLLRKNRQLRGIFIEIHNRKQGELLVKPMPPSPPPQPALLEAAEEERDIKPGPKQEGIKACLESRRTHYP